MPEARTTPPFLLAGFAEFFEEVANLKSAIAEGRLNSYLAGDGSGPATNGAELALRASSRLAGVLRAQARDIKLHGTGQEIKACTVAQYVMAALADEIFILDPQLEWDGRDAWLDVLLEHRMFRSHDAGHRFFAFADQILRASSRSGLHAELASVFLLALQLGFKGRHRGEHGALTLRQYRQRLYQFVRANGDIDPALPAFPQAYAHLAQGDKDARYAPLSRWMALARIGLLGYLVLSTLLWVALMVPFEKAFGG